MLIPTLEGWTVETVGDDIAWMKFGDDGRLYAINPEAGFFGVAPGTGEKTNPNAMATIRENTIFTNCALTDDGDVWWEGMTAEPPAPRDRLAAATTGRRSPTTPAAHPNARFTTPAAQDPAIAARVGGPRGRADRRDAVRRPPLDGRAARPRGLRLGARRLPRRRRCARRRPRPRPARSASCASTRSRCCRSAATTWPTTSRTGSKIGEREGATLPQIFYVNWFRKDDDGRFLWPGFGENSRVLEWVFRRCDDAVEARRDADRPRPDAGRRSTPTGLDIARRRAGARSSPSTPSSGRREIPPVRELFAKFGDRLPAEVGAQLDALEERLSQAMR